MKALSIQQPWAWLIVNGYKTIENRSWSTSYRGEFLIHASKKADQAAIDQGFPGIVLPESYETGGIVGKATLVDIVSESSSSWFTGKFGFVLEDATPVSFIKSRGALGLFELPDRVDINE